MASRPKTVQRSAAPVEADEAGGRLAPLPPGKIRLHKHADIENGFVKIAHHCLLTIEWNRRAWLESDFADGLHQMRVGLRRLRSALQLFKDAFHLPDALAGELRWLLSVLGPARDWEVFCATTLPQVDACSAGQADLGFLQKEAATKARETRRAAMAAVQSPRYHSLRLALNLWLDNRAWHDNSDAAGRAMPLAAFAADRLTHRHRSLVRSGSKLDVGDPDTHHRLRIAVKRARYTVEFFQPLFPARPIRRYLLTLNALQDQLGTLNDLAVACILLETLAKSRRRGRSSRLIELAFVRGFLVATMRQKMEVLAHCRLPEKLPPLG